MLENIFDTDEESSFELGSPVLVVTSGIAGSEVAGVASSSSSMQCVQGLQQAILESDLKFDVDQEGIIIL